MTDPVGISALRDHPELARLVGLVVADFAILEFDVFLVLALCSPNNPAASFQAYYREYGTKDKAALARGAAKKMIAGERFRAFDKLLSRFVQSALRRTEVAHAVFQGDSHSVLRLRSDQGNPFFEPLEASLLEDTLTEYRILHIDLAALAVIAAPSEAALHHTIHALPRAPHLSTLVGHLAPHHPSSLPRALLEASLKRQKLLHLLPDQSR